MITYILILRFLEVFTGCFPEAQNQNIGNHTWLHNNKYYNLGDFITNKSNLFSFDDDTIYRAAKLLGHNVNKMTPAYFSKLCGTTGFLIFLVKDMLEYAGVLVDRKVNNLRIYKNMQYEEYKEKIYSDKLGDFLEVVNDKAEKAKKLS